MKLADSKRQLRRALKRLEQTEGRGKTALRNARHDAIKFAKDFREAVEKEFPLSPRKTIPAQKRLSGELTRIARKLLKAYPDDNVVPIGISVGRIKEKTEWCYAIGRRRFPTEASISPHARPKLRINVSRSIPKSKLGIVFVGVLKAQVRCALLELEPWRELEWLAYIQTRLERNGFLKEGK